MQSQEPPAPNGEPPVGGQARHRHRRTDPPVPPDGAPLTRPEPAPGTAAEYPTRYGGDGGPGTTTPPPPWAQGRADPDGRLHEARTAQPAEPPGRAGTGVPTGSPYADVAASPDLADGPEHGGAAAGRATAWFDDGAPASPATGVPGVPPPADRRSGGWSPVTHVREAPADQERVGGDDDPEGRPSPAVPRPRPSPSPRRPAPDVADDGPSWSTPGAVPVAAGAPPVSDRLSSDGGAASSPAIGATAARGPAGTPGAGEPGAAVERGDHPAGRPDVAEAPQERTGPVLDRPLRDEGHGHGTSPGSSPGSGPGSGEAGRTGARAALVVDPGVCPSTDPGEGDDSGDPGPDTGYGAVRHEPAARRRRTLPSDTDRLRTVSDAARERGLPVREPGGPTAAAGTGHGHGHGHSPATPTGKRVRILLAALLVPCALATLAGVALLWPGASPVPSVPPQQQVHGDVQTVQAADCTPGSGAGGCTGVTLRLTDGPRAGSDLVQLVPAEPSTPRFAVGDRVVLAWSGGNPDDAGSYQITDFQRGAPLAWLAAAFAVAVLALGRWRGLAALVALVLSFAVLVLFVMPSILSGNNPLAVAVTGAGVIMFVVLYLSHGFSARTSCAVLGTLVSLALIGGLGALFTVTTRLTGLDDTTANLIGTLGNIPIDARGLVLAGLVIGALGVLDDVTVTQASAVWELRDANPSLGPGKLFAAGMRIGRDHVSSAVNTLVLAYAGAALPLMLLFTVSSASFGQVVTTQDVATEIVRTLVGSIGLVASVPLTTGLAALVAARR